MDKKREVGRVILLTLAFWVLVMFGPILVSLWNALSPRYARYYPGDLGYLVIMTLAQGIACVMAFCAASGIGTERHNVAVFANVVIAATVLGSLGLWGLIAQRWQNAISLLIGMAVLIVAAVSTAKEMGNK